MTATAARAAPFRGLAPYGDGDADGDTFFGRARETEIVVANLLASRLTVLYGPSGVGKTSLLRAGVARRVRELAARRAPGDRPDGAIVVFASWSGDPVRDLEAAVAAEVLAVAGRDDVLAPPATTSLADALEHWAAVLDGHLYLVLDQLEELFVYQGADRTAGSLLNELPDVISRAGLRTHVLFSLRDDALAQLDVLNGVVPGLFANTVRLDRLDRAGARAAIIGCVQAYDDAAPPADRVAVEPALADRVLDETTTAHGRIEAPYLQLVMERLWDEELARGSRVLRASTLAALGGATRIVQDHLGRALASLPEREQEVAARMFEHLVTPSGTKIAHRSVDLAQFARAPQADADVALRQLARERILRPLDEDGGAGRRYEIFHDVLADAILTWSRRREVEHERRAARTHKRRLVAVAVTSLVAILVMAAVTIFALSQRHTAQSARRSAQARALAATALTQLGTDPELSLLLARRAAGLNGSTLVEDVLRRSLLESHVRRVVPLGAGVSAAVFRGDRTTIAAVTTAGRVVVADAGSGRVLRSFTTGSSRDLVDPTGRWVLAFGLHRRPILFAVPSGVAVGLDTRPVTSAVFSDDGRILVTMDTGRLLHVWDATGGRLLATLEAERPVRVAAVSADDAEVATAGGSDGRSVDVFSAQSGRRVASLPEGKTVTQVVYDPTGRYLAVGRADETVTLRDARTGARLGSYAGHVGAITAVAFSPDGNLLATSSTDGTARVFATRDGLVSQLTGHGLGVTSIVFSPDGGRAATVSTDRTARVWDVRNGRQVAVLAGHGEPVTSARFSADGRSIVTAAADGTMRIWSALSEPSLTVVRAQRAPVPAARATSAGLAVAPTGSADVTVSPDRTLVATASHSAVVVRRASGGKVLARVGLPSPATGVALAPTDASVAVAGQDGRVRVYGFDGTLRRTLGGGPPLTRLSFSPDGSLLAAGSTDHTVRLWSLSTGAERVLRGHTDAVESARFSPDGSRLVTASADHLVRVWDVASGQTTLVLRGAFGRVSDASFSPDGRWIVTAGPGKAGLFDARSGVLLFYLQGHRGPLTSASFAPDGQTVVTSGVDGTVRTYRCDVCVGLNGLKRLADERLAATHRVLTARERRDYLP